MGKQSKDTPDSLKNNVGQRLPLERQMILRLPPDVAARLRAVLRRQDELSERDMRSRVAQLQQEQPQCTVQFDGSRRGRIVLQLPPTDAEAETEADADADANGADANGEGATDAGTGASGGPAAKRPRLVRDELKFVLADLPCLLESYRVNTKPGSAAASSDGHLVKSADIGQIVVAQRLDDAAECCDRRGRFPSGLTPLTHDIVREFDERQSERRVPPSEIDRLETAIVSKDNAE